MQTQKSKYGRLTPQFKLLWLSALLSGKYRQGRGGLKQVNVVDEETYCCLGVACDLTGEGEWESPASYSRFAGFKSKYSSQFGDLGRIPRGLAEKLGLTEAAQGKLIDMNDSKNWSFKRIANWIDKNL
jgi:hypothetical protein